MNKQKLLIPGNKKLDRSILTFSLPPVITCGNCSECKLTCYARKAWIQYPNVRECWTNNYEMAKNHPDEMRRLIFVQLKTTKAKAVRIHVAGDYFSQTYLDDVWGIIAYNHPRMRFFGYSKMFDELDFSMVNGLENVNIIDSFINKQLNYGSRAHCEYLVEAYDAYLCPCSEDNYYDIKCGRDCHYCLEMSRPCFIQH